MAYINPAWSIPPPNFEDILEAKSKNKKLTCLINTSIYEWVDSQWLYTGSAYSLNASDSLTGNKNKFRSNKKLLLTI